MTRWEQITPSPLEIRGAIVGRLRLPRLIGHREAAAAARGPLHEGARGDAAAARRNSTQHDTPRWPQEAPRWPHGPNRPPGDPRWPQDGPEISQDGPKRHPDGPNMAPRGSNVAP